MAKQAKTKTAAAQVVVPQSVDEASRFVAEIGELTRQRIRIEADMNDALAATRAQFEADGAPLNDKLRALTEGLRIWASANRQALTQGGKVKFARLAAGEIKWRMAPPKVAVRGVEAVLDALRRGGLMRFIRTKEEINKDAILADPAAVSGIAGIAIEQAEEFVVEPFDTALSDARAEVA